MFITKKHLSRRTVLKGAGVSLGLPFLDAMTPAGTAFAQTAAVPKLRMGFFYMPHGAIMANWTPDTAGAGWGRGTGGGVGAASAWSAASAGTPSRGGATGRGSTGNKCVFCAAHLAARPLSGLLVL